MFLICMLFRNILCHTVQLLSLSEMIDVGTQNCVAIAKLILNVEVHLHYFSPINCV
jgi:hypothetical protein